MLSQFEKKKRLNDFYVGAFKISFFRRVRIPEELLSKLLRPSVRPSVRLSVYTHEKKLVNS
jgi:hypothetical protein